MGRSGDLLFGAGCVVAACVLCAGSAGCGGGLVVSASWADSSVSSADGLVSVWVFVLECVIGMKNVLGVVSSVLRLPSSWDCIMKLSSDSVSSASRWLSVSVSWM